MFSLTHNRLRWTIVGAITLMLIIILTVKFDIFADKYTTSCIGNQSKTMGTVDADEPLSQSFIPEKRHLSFVEVRVATYSEAGETGQMLFTITDSEGSILDRQSALLTDVRDNGYFRFDTDLVLDRNMEYTILLQTTGVRSERSPVVWVSTASKGAQTRLSIPGAYSGEDLQINAQYGYEQINYIAFFVSLGLLLLCGAAALVDLRLSERQTKAFSFGVMLIMPLVSFLIAEILNDSSLLGKTPQAYVVNYIFYLLIYMLMFTIINRLRISVIVSNLLIYTVAVINYYKILFRGEPVQLWDIVTVRTAINVSGQYPLLLSSTLVLTFLSLVLIGIMIAKLKVRTESTRKRTVGGALSFILLVGLVLSLFATDRYQITRLSFMQKIGITNNVWNQPANYSANGLLLALTMNAQDLIVREPEGYSENIIGEMSADLKARVISERNRAMIEPYANNVAEAALGPVIPPKESRPNIIVIMDESYTDLTDVAPFEMNQSVNDYISSLRTDTIRGSLYVSTFGGGTANSEFEFLTGNSMAYLPGGSVPYLQYVDEKTGSLPWILKQNGYSTIAVHPYLDSGWSRPIAYERLGFDRFVSIDDFRNPEYIREYVSDRSSFDKVIELYEQKGDQPIFLFNVTMQNHGGYGKTHGNFREDVRLSEYPDRFPETEQYLSLIRKTDEAVRELIEYFSRRDEPTIILFFGDHAPSMKNGFYETILNSSMSELPAEDMQKLYRTEYFIWANYDIVEASGRNMSTNYLSTVLMDIAGIDMPGYNLYLKDLYRKYPVISTMGIIDSSGRRYDCVSAVPDEDGSLRDYSYFIYNNLFGDTRRNASVFDEPLWPVEPLAQN
ncbi:MAG: sulfatase-like hydrolase/transferase [Clostridiaceae bacterium]|nr:sulfatase-like hydrolase/transferase [Clostridiaceae bacterium]